MTASSAGQVLPMVTPMPLARRMDVGAQGASLEVTKQPVMATIPLSMMGRMRLLTVLMALTVTGATQPIVTPLTQLEVVVDMTDWS